MSQVAYVYYHTVLFAPNLVHTTGGLSSTQGSRDIPFFPLLRGLQQTLSPPPEKVIFIKTTAGNA